MSPASLFVLAVLDHSYFLTNFRIRVSVFTKRIKLAGFFGWQVVIGKYYSHNNTKPFDPGTWDAFHMVWSSPSSALFYSSQSKVGNCSCQTRRMSKSVVLSDIMRGFLKFHCVFIATLLKKISFYMMLMLCPVALLNLLVLVVSAFLFV